MFGCCRRAAVPVRTPRGGLCVTGSAYGSNLSHLRAYGGRYIRSRILAAVFREPQWSPCVYQMLIRPLIRYSKRNMSSICAYVLLSIRSLLRRATKFSGMHEIGEMQSPVPRLTGCGAHNLTGTDAQVPLPHRGNMGHFSAFPGVAAPLSRPIFCFFSF